MQQLFFDFPEDADPAPRSRLTSIDLLLAPIEARIDLGTATADDLARRERLIHRREVLLEEGDEA